MCRWFRAKVYKTRKKFKFHFLTRGKKIIESFKQTAADVQADRFSNNNEVIQPIETVRRFA